MWPIIGFPVCFRSSRLTAVLLTVAYDGIARAFNRSGTTRAITLDLSKAFNRVWHAGLLHKLKSYGIPGQMFGLISYFLSSRWLWVVLDGKSWQEYPANTGVLQGSVLGPTLFLLYINDFPMMISVILLSRLMILLSALSVIRHLICGINYSWLLNLNAIYKTLWTRARSGLVISLLEKFNWFRVIGLIKLVLLMWKWIGLFLRKIIL